MVRVAIVLPQRCSLFSSVVRLCQIFDFVNSLARQHQEGLLFSVDIIGATSLINLYGNSHSIRPHFTIYDSPHENDLVIIPALAGHIAENLKNSQSFIPWLINQYDSGAEIAGLCTGVFLLSDTFLINKLDCTRKWYVSASFRKEFSQINKVAEDVILEEQSVFTDCGAYTFIKKLLESTVDIALAELCASMFEIEFNRECQSVFSIVQQEKHMKRFSKKNTPLESSALPPDDFSLYNDALHCIPDYLRRSKDLDQYGAAENPENTKFSEEQHHINTLAFKKSFKQATGK